MKYLTFIGLAAFAQGAIAADYVLDASTMAVGATANENLVVQEGCLDPTKTSCTDKVRYLTASSPAKVGNVQILGNLTGDFEIIVTADFASSPKGIKILTADNKGFGLSFNGDKYAYYFLPSGIGEGGTSYGDTLLGWASSNAFNEVKISVQKGVASVSTNGQTLTERVTFASGQITFDPSVVFTRVSIEGIKSDDRLSDIKVRGMQTVSSCSASTSTTSTTQPTTGNCTATYNASTGRLAVPCVAVPVTQPFGGTQTVNYSIEMQQRTSGFVFDLDLNTVKPR
jgi:hypothetical protein